MLDITRLPKLAEKSLVTAGNEVNAWGSLRQARVGALRPKEPAYATAQLAAFATRAPGRALLAVWSQTRADRGWRAPHRRGWGGERRGSSRSRGPRWPPVRRIARATAR